jgi:rhodanese-related sulfurtransferase
MINKIITDNNVNAILLSMKLNSFFHQKNIFICTIGLLIGIFFTLIFPVIRYTHLIEPTIKEISPQQAYENIEANPKKYIFIDVRTPYEYLQAHASTSISMPINTLYDKRKELPMNTNQDIYLICTSGRLAGVAYSYLEHYGFRNIYRVTGGLQGWSEANKPIVAKDLFAAPSPNDPLRPMLDIPFSSK